MFTAGADEDITPAPVNFTDCGEPLALSPTVRKAALLPVETGAKRTEIVQLSPTDNVEAHPSVAAKSSDWPPVTEIVLIAKVADPVFVSVTNCDADVVLAACEPNESEATLNLTEGEPADTTPVPDS